MENIVSFLKEHNNYLLLTHRRPDGDTLGSAAALCAGLRAMGKTAYLWRNPEVTGRYLPYSEPYFAPKGYTYDITVAVDTASADLFGEGWSGKVDLRIDHHPSEGGYAGLEYSDPSAAACGEVIQGLLASLGVSLNQEIAVALYVAIATDTGCFRYANTTAKTHRLTAELMDTGIDASKLNASIFSKSRLRLSVESAISRRIEYYAGGLVAVASLSLKERGAATEDDLENLTGLIQGIEDVKVVLVLREYPSGWRVSCRTVDPYSANRICAVLGGGGHARASGADIKTMPQEAARRIALDALWKIHPELRKGSSWTEFC
jgi:phosphoesterase RecJ-like protein